MEASLPSLTAYLPSGTTSNMSPCCCPDFMYSTNPEVVQSGIASFPVTTDPFNWTGFGPFSKPPFGNGPEKIYKYMLYSLLCSLQK